MACNGVHWLCITQATSEGHLQDVLLECALIRKAPESTEGARQEEAGERGCGVQLRDRAKSKR